MRVDARPRALERIEELSHRGLDVTALIDEASPLVDTLAPSSHGLCWSVLDPASLLLTASVAMHEDPVPLEAVVAEYLGDDDLLQTRDVVRCLEGAQTLLGVTDGEPERCAAYRSFMQPVGIQDFAEVALRTRRGDCWGTVGLARGDGEPAYDDEEVALLRAASAHLGEGLRRGLLIGEARDPESPESPGLVVLDDGWEVESLSPGVERWLADLPGHWEAREEPPPAVVSVAARALRTATDPDAPGEVAVARVLSRRGHWLVLHGAALVASGRRKAGVIIEPAHPVRITPLLMRVYGLTEREQDVARHVLCGDSTSQIARALHLSQYTVQQHLTSIFDKTGVRSRRDLVGKVFFAHYEPRVRDNELRAEDGRPLRGGPLVAD